MTAATDRLLCPPEIRAAMGAEPTDDQWRAISMPLEPYVIVAGAGSGKTSVIAARVVYLALVATGAIQPEPGHAGVLPGNVLCLTFTNKATEHLTLKIRRALQHLDLLGAVVVVPLPAAGRPGWRRGGRGRRFGSGLGPVQDRRWQRFHSRSPW